MVLCVVGLFANNPLVAQGPENTLVVVNADSPDSLAVANCYINLRDIPAKNVVYINKVPRATTSSQSTSGAKFENKILKPIFRCHEPTWDRKSN